MGESSSWFTSVRSGLALLGARGNIDWILFAATLPIVGMGLLTMNSFVGETSFFSRQLMWAAISIAVFFGLSFFDFRFLRRTGVLVSLFLAATGVLLFLLLSGEVIRGTQSWITVGGLSVEPVDPIKLILILILAKYFSRRHIEIANVKHIIISGLYAFSIFALVFLQPDFGSAMIIFSIWLGMVMISGISKKHLFAVVLILVLTFGGLWFYVFRDYQKQRIISFLNPLTDIQGAGYNAYQSTIAVGSGQVWGKGVGYGTQSRLNFLPEYETDFIFAAFAEEWGFLGVTLLLLCYAVLIWRIFVNSIRGATNFEILFGFGLAVLFASHIFIHIGMNIGLLPITGITLPLASYGGSHLLTEFVGLGMLMGMRRYARAAHKEAAKNELLGPQ